MSYQPNQQTTGSGSPTAVTAAGARTLSTAETAFLRDLTNRYRQANKENIAPASSSSSPSSPSASSAASAARHNCGGSGGGGELGKCTSTSTSTTTTTTTNTAPLPSSAFDDSIANLLSLAKTPSNPNGTPRDDPHLQHSHHNLYTNANSNSTPKPTNSCDPRFAASAAAMSATPHSTPVAAGRQQQQQQHLQAILAAVALLSGTPNRDRNDNANNATSGGGGGDGWAMTPAGNASRPSAAAADHYHNLTFEDASFSAAIAATALQTCGLNASLMSASSTGSTPCKDRVGGGYGGGSGRTSASAATAAAELQLSLEEILRGCGISGLEDDEDEQSSSINTYATATGAAGVFAESDREDDSNCNDSNVDDGHSGGGAGWHATGRAKQQRSPTASAAVGASAESTLLELRAILAAAGIDLPESLCGGGGAQAPLNANADPFYAVAATATTDAPYAFSVTGVHYDPTAAGEDSGSGAAMALLPTPPPPYPGSGYEFSPTDVTSLLRGAFTAARSANSNTNGHSGRNSDGDHFAGLFSTAPPATASRSRSPSPPTYTDFSVPPAPQQQQQQQQRHNGSSNNRYSMMRGVEREEEAEEETRPSSYSYGPGGGGDGGATGPHQYPHQHQQSRRPHYMHNVRAAAGSLIAVGGRRIPVDKLHLLHVGSGGDGSGTGGGSGECELQPSSRRMPTAGVHIKVVAARDFYDGNDGGEADDNNSTKTVDHRSSGRRPRTASPFGPSLRHAPTPLGPRRDSSSRDLSPLSSGTATLPRSASRHGTAGSGSTCGQRYQDHHHHHRRRSSSPLMPSAATATADDNGGGPSQRRRLVPTLSLHDAAPSARRAVAPAPAAAAAAAAASNLTVTIAFARGLFMRFRCNSAAGLAELRAEEAATGDRIINDDGTFNLEVVPIGTAAGKSRDDDDAARAMTGTLTANSSSSSSSSGSGLTTTANILVEVGAYYCVRILSTASPYDGFGYMDCGRCVAVAEEGDKAESAAHGGNTTATVMLSGVVIGRSEAENNNTNTTTSGNDAAAPTGPAARRLAARAYVRGVTASRFRFLNLPFHLVGTHLSHDQRLLVVAYDALGAQDGSGHPNVTRLVRELQYKLKCRVFLRGDNSRSKMGVV